MQDKPNGVYRPGPALYAVGMAAISRARHPAESPSPSSKQLRDKTKETTSLAVLEGTMIRFIECYEGLSTVRIGEQDRRRPVRARDGGRQGDARRAVG